HLRPAVGAAEGHGDAGTDGVVRPRLRCGQSGPVGSALPQRVPPGGRHDDRHRLRALTPYGHAPEGATVRPAASLRSIRPTVTSSSAAFTNRRVPATNLIAGRHAWSVLSSCPPPGEILRRCRGALRGDRPPGERPGGSPRRHLRERNRRHHGPQRSRGGRLLGGASLMNAAGRLAVYCAGLAVAFVSASVAAGAVIPAP